MDSRSVQKSHREKDPASSRNRFKKERRPQEQIFSEDSQNPTTRRGLIENGLNDSDDFDDLAEKTRPFNKPKTQRKPKSSNLTNETSDVDIKHNPNSDKGDAASNLGGKSERSSISKIEKKKYRERPLAEIIGVEQMKRLPSTNDPAAYFEDKEEKENAMKLLAQTF